MRVHVLARGVPRSIVRMGFALEPGSFRGLIFDCDGTLVETLPAHVAALQSTLEPLGLRPTMEWARTKYGQSPATVLLALEQDYAPIAIPHSEVLRAWSANFGRHLDKLEEIAAVADIARAWKGRVPMAVASNGHRSSVRATLNAAGLLPLFDEVVSVEDVKAGKPEPDLFLEAARRMGVLPQECVVFEDSAEGMEAARRAGMRVVFAPDVATES